MNVEKDNSLDVAKAMDYARKASVSKPKHEYVATKVDPHKRNTQSQVSQISNTKSAGTKIRNVKTDLTEAEHGDIVVGSDGIVGIVRERGHSLKQIEEDDEIFQLMKSIVNEEDTTFAGIDKYYTANDNESEEKRYRTKIADNKFSNEALKLDEVKRQFADWEIIPCDKSTGAVMAPKGDPRAEAYKRAMNDLRSGKFRLPTISEYEAQKKAAEEKKKTVKVGSKSKNKISEPNMAVTQPESVKIEQPKPEAIQNEPSISTDIDAIDPIVKEDIEDMPSIDKVTREVINNAAEDPIMAAMQKLDADKTQAKPEEQVSSGKTVNMLPDVKPEVPVFNLAAAEENITKSNDETVDQEAEQQKESESVTFEVPASKATTFINSMPPEMKEKVEASKKINVIYAKDITLPKTARRLDIAGYRKVAPKNTSLEMTSAVLVNSGYIGYFKAVGALKWSTISPIIDEDGRVVNNPSPSKIAQFCYEQLYTTSIGKLSYKKFCEQTAATDIPAMLYAIMRASLPDEQEVTLVCPNDLDHNWQSKYSISQLPNYEDIPNETKAQIMLIMQSKDTVEDAQDTHNASPVMSPLVYTPESTKSKFIIKHFDIATSNDRSGVIQQLIERYGESAAVLAQCTKMVYVQTEDKGNDDDWAISDDPAAICEEYFRLTSEEMQDIMGIVQNIPDFVLPTYSLKGEYVCPHCGTRLVNPQQPLQELVFQLALKARYLG